MQVFGQYMITDFRTRTLNRFGGARTPSVVYLMTASPAWTSSRVSFWSASMCTRASSACARQYVGPISSPSTSRLGAHGGSDGDLPPALSSQPLRLPPPPPGPPPIHRSHTQGEGGQGATCRTRRRRPRGRRGRSRARGAPSTALPPPAPAASRVTPRTRGVGGWAGRVVGPVSRRPGGTGPRCRCAPPA
jgi:hypothetical protein